MGNRWTLSLCSIEHAEQILGVSSFGVAMRIDGTPSGILCALLFVDYLLFFALKNTKEIHTS